jgi:plastocyanin
MADETTPVTRRGLLRAAAGATVVTGATGTAAASSEGGSSGTTVDVGPGGQNVFAPETAYVTPGTTVTFSWKSDGHNVVPTSQPDGANWEGVTALRDTGYSHTHTFETLGTYDYVCEPHESLGMVGAIEVTENPPENEGYQSILPDTAKTLGVATVGAMSSVLGLAYFFMKYGGDYGESTEE